MECESFQLHESGEDIDKSLHGKDFEKDFGKFLLFRLICQRENFQNFRFTREKKGTGKFDDFVFVYDSDDGKTKYSLIQLKHLSDEKRKINFEDLKANSKSYFGLPYYFDYYTKSLSCLSNDKDLKEAELEGLLFCTNAGIEDSLGCISKREILNEGLFRNSGKLYKLSINDEERQEIFREQFLSERRRLANELASYVMQNKVIHLESMITDDSFSLILKFSEMLLDHVVDVKENKFKISFLDSQLKNINEELDNFRNELFESLFDYQENSPYAKKIPTDKKDTDGFIEFLREKTNPIKIPKNFECKSLRILSEKLVLSVMLQKPFDIKANIHDQKILQKLNKFIRENVIDLGSKKLKETFLSGNSKSNKEVNDFRQYFFEDLKVFCNAFKYKNDKEIEEFVKVYNSQLSVQTFEFSLKLILEKGENEVIEFLKQKEIRFAEFPDTEAVIDIFPSGEVDTKETDDNILAFLNLVTFAVNQNNFGNLISKEMNKLITKSEDQILLHSGFNNITDSWHNEGALSLNIVSKLKYRKWVTEKELLNDIKILNILFQGREVKLSDICSGCEIIKIITPELFMYHFSTSAIMNLGEVIDKNFNSFYIDRTLIQREIVNINSLLEESQDIVVITLHERFDPSVVDELLSSPVKIKDLQFFNEKHNYYFTRQNFTFKSFLNFYDNNKNVISERKVHWITFLGKDFIYESSIPNDNNNSEQGCEDSEYSEDSEWEDSEWEDSEYSEDSEREDSEYCSNSNLIEKYLYKKSFTCYEIFENENFVIVTGDPGIGKSVLLKHLSIEVKNSNKDQFWVILIPLNTCQNYLDDYDNFNVDNIIDFLAKIENCKNDFSKMVLEYLLRNNRLILLFDGFDEIHDHSKQEKILGLLKFLKNENLTKHMWISSRPSCVRQIEEVLGCAAFDVNDISEDEQIKLVIDEWKVYYGNDNSKVNLIEENASNFVKNINDYISRDERDFLGVPLLTYMFSHAYKNEAIKTSFLPKGVGLVRLFEDFILSKYNIFFSEKAIADKILRNDFINVYEKRYQLYALKYSEIISPEHFDMLSKVVDTNLSYDSIEILKRIGLIYETNSVSTFIHKSFAEYYIADLLLSITENCKTENILKSGKSILLEPENGIILYIFDAHLIKKFEGYEIQESIMNGDKEILTSLDKESLSTLDIFGRNCFYYALQQSPFPILSLLISKDIELIFEPFFVKILKDFADKFVKFHKRENEEVYLELFGYILEKEKENGYFACECLDQCLRLDSEIRFGHWEIATKLINKFGRKVDDTSWLSHYVLKAPEEFFDAYVKLLAQEESPNWLNVIELLISFHLDRLKETIIKHSEFILRMNIFGGITRIHYFLSKGFFQFEKFSEYVKFLKKRTENFSFLFKFLFESKDVSFEDFDDHSVVFHSISNSIEFSFIPYRTREGIYRIIPPLIFPNFDKPIHSLKVSNELNSYSSDLLNTLLEYMDICKYDENTNADDAALEVTKYILSRGDEEHVKRVYNECYKIANRNYEEASRYWEEAKRTELSKYYKIKIKN
ncbi:UNVERIFIED_CONTAM: hypothetical protein RMT77_016590 [Armadillidium vulgare]